MASKQRLHAVVEVLPRVWEVEEIRLRSREVGYWVWGIGWGFWRWGWTPLPILQSALWGFATPSPFL